ncbi:hypothetical protein [Nocardia vaccinii]|uniref:hypothetical protein n=1 Tax=Nocardia vaccinii TaxID=1822 RepID=UPI000A9B35EE|nr:hypothetical protein [Nocardia vaccinii]
MLCMTGVVEGWNNSVTRTNRPDLAVQATFHGDAVQVRVPDDAVRGFLPIMEEVVSPDGELYDATFEVFVRSSSREPVVVDIGGKHTYSSLSQRELRYWVPNLHRYARTPFLIVSKTNDTMSFIQTHRGGPLRRPDEPITYALEIARGSTERHYTAEPELNDPATVADLIWDWVQDRWDRLHELRWNKYGRDGACFPVGSLDE